MPNLGKIIQVMGPVVDVQFAGEMPQINNALEIKVKPEDNTRVPLASGTVKVLVVAAEIPEH